MANVSPTSTPFPGSSLPICARESARSRRISWKNRSRERRLARDARPFRVRGWKVVAARDSSSWQWYESIIQRAQYCRALALVSGTTGWFIERAAGAVAYPRRDSELVDTLSLPPCLRAVALTAAAVDYSNRVPLLFFFFFFSCFPIGSSSQVAQDLGNFFLSSARTTRLAWRYDWYLKICIFRWRVNNLDRFSRILSFCSN